MDENFSNKILDMFEEYNNKIGNWGGTIEEWITAMISIIHEDWKNRKLTDQEFAHLIDNVLCF